MAVGSLSLLLLRRDSEAAVGGLRGGIVAVLVKACIVQLQEIRAASVAMERVCRQASACEQCHVEYQNVFAAAAPLRPSLVGKEWAHRRT
jgi:hypothetical protein